MSNHGWPDAVGDDVDDILDAIQGDDDYEDEMGATKRRKKLRNRDFPIGFAGLTPTSIGTGVTSDVTVPLQAWLRPNRLVLGAAACVDLSYVMDVKVGTISLNVGSQGVPCAAFARDAVGTSLNAAVWASPSVPPVVRIYNNTGGTIVYAGGFVGPVSRSEPGKG